MILLKGQHRFRHSGDRVNASIRIGGMDRAAYTADGCPQHTFVGGSDPVMRLFTHNNEVGFG